MMTSTSPAARGSALHRSIVSAARQGMVALVLGAALMPGTLAFSQPVPGDERGERDGRREGDGRRDYPGGPGGRDRGDFRGGGGFGGPWMGGGVGEMLEPEFIRRDLVLINRELELDDDQDAIVETLLLDYETEFFEALENGRERMNELQPADPEREARRERRRAMRDEIDAMRDKIRAVREDAARLEATQLQTDDEKKMAAEVVAVRAQQIEQLRDEMFIMREESREMRPRFEPADRERFGETLATLARELETERERLRATFLSNLKAILAEEQLAGWTKFERALRRSKSLGRGRLSAESTDLFLVLQEQDLAPDSIESVRNELDAYAAALDSALRARDDFLREHRIDSMQAMFAGETEKVIETAKREQELRVAVRDVNERYATLIGEGLTATTDGAAGRSFLEGFRERAYERVFRPTRVQRAIEDAIVLEGIDETLLASLFTLQESYLTELGTFNERLVSTIRAEEPGQSTRWIEWVARRMQEGGPGGPGGPERGAGGEDRPEDKVREAFDERREMNDRYRERLEALLAPEQAEQLSSLDDDRDRDGRGDRGGWRGGDDRGGWRGDGDGEDRQEREARRDRLMGQYDTNGDGQLDASERDAARKAMSGQRNDNDETND